MPRQGLGISLQKSNYVFKKNGAYTYGYFDNNSLCVPSNIELAYKAKDSVNLWCVYNTDTSVKLAHGKYDDGGGVRYVFENGIKGDIAKHDDGPFSYGYYHDGEIDIRTTSTHIDIDTKTKRFYVKGLPANGSYVDDSTEDNYLHDFVDGIKGHISADTLLKDNIDCFITINGDSYKNGVYSIFADGKGSEYKIYQYYPKGDVITQDVCYSYISDGLGGKYDVHNSGAYKDGYYKDGKITSPNDTSYVYSILDDTDKCGTYTDTGAFSAYANNILKFEDGKYYYFSNGIKNDFVNGALQLDSHLASLLSVTNNETDTFIEFEKGVYVGLANGYFTNGAFKDGMYDYNTPEYKPTHPKDDSVNYYVYHWCGLPFYSRPADGAYSQGFYNYGVKEEEYNNNIPQKSSNDEEWYVYVNGKAIKPDYSKASINVFLEKDNNEYFILSHVTDTKYHSNDISVIKNTEWCIIKDSSVLYKSVSAVLYPWQTTKWVNENGDVANIYIEPVWLS